MPKPSLNLAVKQQTKVKPTVVTSTKLGALLEKQLQLSAKLSQLKLAKDDVDKQLIALGKRHGIKPGVGGEINGEFLLTVVAAVNRYVDPAALLKAGVRASTIRAATKETPYTYPRVTRKKHAPEDAESGE